ncbi:MAG TPA: hypothetical protein VMU28_15690 [Terriglobales bacterium]|nr:hypothetical protein [Terriglobales bacterium]
MKRGSEAELPPCPDAAPDTSPDSLPPSAPLIERARYVAFQFAQKLPNFVCEEYMARYRQQGSDKVLIDIVSAEVVYSNGKETYRNVKVNSRPTAKGMMELGGAWSTGEFASMLLDLFSTPTDAQFRLGGSSSISGYKAQVYDFRVQRENSHWNVEAESQALRPAYEGSVWVDPATARVLRVEMQALKLPSDFPMATVETAVDYSSVRIGETSSLLPVHAETLGCERGSPDCSHNIIDFRNYHEFKVDFKISGVAN